ncbi:MAG: hypothetical protein C0432_01700 [Candidatus Puniceispirillum sp.]|nr:hypothetical protein [Candidatus Pelagibacter sp.]MBA4282991.1 hypothetical protein [Candidatus Puniceispirillum sp.]
MCTVAFGVSAQVAFAQESKTVKTENKVATATAVKAKASKPALSETESLRKELDLVKKQIAQLKKTDTQLKATDQVNQAGVIVTAAEVLKTEAEVAASKRTLKSGQSLVRLGDSNVFFGMGGRVKLDVAHYPKSGPNPKTSGNYLDPKTIGLDGSDLANNKNNTDMTAQNSRVNFYSLAETAHGDLESRVTFDFLGAQNSGHSFNSTPSTNYGLRARSIYVDYCGFRLGQDDTNFFTGDFAGYSFDNYGVNVPLRRPQVRYTHELTKGLNASVSIEKPNSDYVTRHLAFSGNNTFGKSTTPDATLRLRYDHDLGFVSLSGIYRRISVDVPTGSTVPGSAAVPVLGGATTREKFTSHKNGFGGALMGSVKVYGDMVRLFGYVIAGQGISNLVMDGGTSAYLQYTLTTDVVGAGVEDAASISNLARWKNDLGLVKVLSGSVGVEFKFNENWKFVTSGIMTTLKYPSNAAVSKSLTDQLNKNVNRVFANVVYSPSKQLDLVLEVMHAQRKTLKGKIHVDGAAGDIAYSGTKGKATQITASAVYKFNY